MLVELQAGKRMRLWKVSVGLCSVQTFLSHIADFFSSMFIDTSFVRKRLSGSFQSVTAFECAMD